MSPKRRTLGGVEPMVVVAAACLSEYDEVEMIGRDSIKGRRDEDDSLQAVNTTHSQM